MPLALAPKYDTRTVTGTYLHADGTPHAGGLVIITYPTLRRVSGVIVEPGPITITLDQAGRFTADLPVTDDPDVVGSSPVLIAEPGATHRRAVQIPRGAAPISMADLPDVAVVPTDDLFFDPALMEQLDARVDAVESRAVMGGSALPVGADLNDQRSAGIWFCPSAINRPTSNQGLLTVLTDAAATAVTQIYHQASGEFWTRGYSAGWWSGWRRGQISDTGWRDVTALCVPGSLDPSNTGKLLARRIDDVVRLRFLTLAAAPGSGSLNFLTALPLGMRPATYVFGNVGLNTNSTDMSTLAVYGTTLRWAAHVVLNTGTPTWSTTRPSGALHGELSYTTNEAWPSTLPGTPA